MDAVKINESYRRRRWLPVTVSKNPARPLKIRLLREAGGLGDIVCCLPALRWLHENFQSAGVTARGLELLQHFGVCGVAEGEPCELVLYGLGPYRAVWEMSGVRFEWRSQQFNGASRRDRWTDPREHYGENGDEFALSLDLWCPFWLHEIAPEAGNPVRSRLQIACDLLGMEDSEIVLPETRPSRKVLEETAQALRLDGWSGEPLALIFPLCQGPARVWPAPRWAEVARGLWQRFGARVMVLAGRTWELNWWRAYAKEFSLKTGLDWPRIAALLHLSDLSLSGDTGPYHLAASCKIPAIGLFGMTGGEITSRHYPQAKWIQGGAGREVVAGTGAVCRAPCYHRWHDGFGGDLCKENGCASLLSIQPDQVLAHAAKLLERKKKLAHA